MRQKHKKAYQSISYLPQNSINNLYRVSVYSSLFQSGSKESEKLVESYDAEFKQRFAKNFLDILILRLIQREPMWGYKIIKEIEEHSKVKIGHGALYPLLNSLETRGYVASKEEVHGKRVRKVYKITSEGTHLINSYYKFLIEQTQTLNLKE